jgi:hypothetical protein
MAGWPALQQLEGVQQQLLQHLMAQHRVGVVLVGVRVLGQQQLLQGMGLVLSKPMGLAIAERRGQ